MMEEAVSSTLVDTLNFFSLGLSVLLLFAVAYLWSSNSRKSDELASLQGDMQRVKKSLRTLEEKVNEIRQPQVIADVPQAAPFGLDLSEHAEDSSKIAPLAPQAAWINFVAEYNELSADPSARGFLRKCERFIQENKLKILTYGGTMTFRPAIDAKDSLYWAFKCADEEYAVVPNPMNPCDETIHEHGGMKEIFALNYEDGVYRKYFVKLPAIFLQDPLKGWVLKNPGVVNLDRN